MKSARYWSVSGLPPARDRHRVGHLRRDADERDLLDPAAVRRAGLEPQRLELASRRTRARARRRASRDRGPRAGRRRGTSCARAAASGVIDGGGLSLVGGHEAGRGRRRRRGEKAESGEGGGEKGHGVLLRRTAGRYHRAFRAVNGRERASLRGGGALRAGIGFARKEIGAHRGLPGEARDDDGRLHQVLALEPLVGVQVRVVRARLVLDLVLDELEPGQADGVERTWSVPPVSRIVTVVTPRSLSGRDPALEDRDDRRVFLGVDAADLARAVVDVEVGGELRVLGLRRDGPRLLPEEVGQRSAASRIGAGGRVAKWSAT